jgi:hypothetical protein
LALKKHKSLSILLCLFVLTLPVFRVSALTATVAVDPSTSNVNVLQTFTVNVTVSNIVNFTSWQFRLYYLNAILSCVNVVEGPFLKTGGGTFFNKTITNNFNGTYGRLLAYCTLLGSTSVNGGGVLATVTFQAVGGGATPLHLADVKLGDEKIPPQPIPYSTIDGTVYSTGVGPTRDVAVTNLTGTKKVICVGSTANYTATVWNIGAIQETFDVILRANGTAAATQTMNNMQNGTNVTITLTWNTTGFAKGNYSISVYAGPVPGETNTADNNCTDGWVVVSMFGDLTGGTPSPWDFVPDGKVDGKDIAIVALCFGSAPGCPPPYIWNANCDVNKDGKVDGKDIALVALHFGQGGP